MSLDRIPGLRRSRTFTTDTETYRYTVQCVPDREPYVLQEEHESLKSYASMIEDMYFKAGLYRRQRPIQIGMIIPLGPVRSFKDIPLGGDFAKIARYLFSSDDPNPYHPIEHDMLPEFLRRCLEEEDRRREDDAGDYDAGPGQTD